MIKKICFHCYLTRTNHYFGKDQHDFYHIATQFYFVIITYYFFKLIKKESSKTDNNLILKLFTKH